MQHTKVRMVLLVLVSLNLGYGQSSGSRQAFIPGTDRVVTSTSHGSVAGTSGPSLPIYVSHSQQAVLIVPSAELPLEKAGALAEDLDVMCAVFDKFLSDAGVKMRSWGMSVHRKRRSTRCIYLPNSGPVFLMETEFLLVPAPSERPKEDRAPDADPVWAAVKSSMSSPGAAGTYRTNRAPLQYDELKVENLKGTLLRAIKHASNVRHVGRDEQITIVVVESSRASHLVTTVRVFGRSDSYDTVTSAAVGPTNVLTLRTGKAQLDALGQKELAPADFRSGVRILSYPLPPLQSTGR